MVKKLSLFLQKSNKNSFRLSFQAIAAASSFYYGTFISVHLQLVILIAFALLTIIVYHYSMTTSTSKVVQEPKTTTNEWVLRTTF